MKKICRYSMLIISVVLLLGLAGCSNNNDDDNYAPVYIDIIEITDPGFDIRIKEIQLNRHEYLGRTIRYEGMFLSSYWEDEAVYFVVRFEGGCCGIHGFEVYLNDIPRFDDETWVEVTGILEEFYVEDTGRYFMHLNVISLEEREPH